MVILVIMLPISICIISTLILDFRTIHMIKDLRKNILVRKNFLLLIFINQETPMRSTIINVAFSIFHVVIIVLINMEAIPTNDRLDKVMIPIMLICLFKGPIEVIWATCVSNKNYRRVMKEEKRRRQLEIRQRAAKEIEMRRQRNIQRKLEEEAIIQSK